MQKSNLKSEKIYQAAQILNLDEKETLADIKKSYHQLLQKWHPDKCNDHPKKCKEKTEEIVEAYEIILNYCQNYRYCFQKENIIDNLPLKDKIRENFTRRFGSDPLWSNNSGENNKGGNHE